MTTSIEEEAALLDEKEHWIQRIAEEIGQTRSIDREAAIAATRWASLWIDDFKILMDEERPTSREAIKRLVDQAWHSSLDRSEGVPRYPAGAPSLRAIIAAKDAFCLSFGPEANCARELLEPEEL